MELELELEELELLEDELELELLELELELLDEELEEELCTSRSAPVWARPSDSKPRS